jgi:hypothetical protein
MNPCDSTASRAGERWSILAVLFLARTISSGQREGDGVYREGEDAKFPVLFPVSREWYDKNERK